MLLSKLLFLATGTRPALIHSQSKFQILQLFCVKSVIGRRELEVSFATVASGFLCSSLVEVMVQGGSTMSTIPALVLQLSCTVHPWGLSDCLSDLSDMVCSSREWREGDCLGKTSAERGGWKNSLFLEALVVCFTLERVTVSTYRHQSELCSIHWNMT